MHPSPTPLIGLQIEQDKPKEMDLTATQRLFVTNVNQLEKVSHDYIKSFWELVEFRKKTKHVEQ